MKTILIGTCANHQVQVASFSSRKFLATSLPGFSGLLFWGGERSCFDSTVRLQDGPNGR